MKKLIFILLLGIATMTVPYVSFGQVALTSQYSLTLDTVTNAGTKIMKVQVKGYQHSVTMQATVTTISGTIAGNIYPVVSIDGVNYSTVGNFFASSDSMYMVTGGGSPQAKMWRMPLGYQYYGLKFVGSGTQATQIKGVVLYRKDSQ